MSKTNANMSKTNAKKELIAHVNGRAILCAYIRFGEELDDDNDFNKMDVHILTTGNTKEDLEIFLNGLDKDYDSGYGGQELFGTIWYKDGTWSTRGEYDGSEWWENHICPEIPKELVRIDKERTEKLNNILT